MRKPEMTNVFSFCDGETLLMKVEVIREGWAEGIGEDRVQCEPQEMGVDECIYICITSIVVQRGNDL